MVELDILKYEAIIGMIEEREKEPMVFSKSGLLPEDSGEGLTFGWDILGVSRDVAKFSSPLAAATPRGLKVIGHQTATLAHSFFVTPIPGGIFMDLRGEGGTARQDAATKRIALETGELADTIDRQNEFLYAKAIQDDLTVTIDAGAAGSIAVSVAYGMPSTNKFDAIGAGAQEIPVAWDNPSAKISEDVRRIKRAVKRASGKTLTDAWVSPRIMHAMCINDDVKDWLRANPAVSAAVLSEGVIVRAFGLNWHEIDETYVDSADAVQYYLPETRAVFTPTPNRSWGFFRKGSTVIPTDDGRGMREVIGRYGYSDLIKDPATLKLFQGECRLPVIRIPGATARATVLA